MPRPGLEPVPNVSFDLLPRVTLADFLAMTSHQTRELAQRLIQQYFDQLTKGCGQDACTNANCATGSKTTIDANDAATKALALALNHSQGKNKLCSAKSLQKKSIPPEANTVASYSASCETAFLQKLTTFSSVKAKHQKITVSVSAPHLSSDQLTKYDGNGQPEARPISSLVEALGWMPGRDNLCVPTLPLKRKQKSAGVMDDPSTPKILVCHDMMGGYYKDRFAQGHSDLEDYYFYHWQYIEAFIYFSHHFLTIPPPCWTNVAHRNGKLSMGTMITEWKDGAILCANLLSSEDKMMQLAKQMMAIAQYYNFDGWLVNIENPINPMLMDQLYTFLSLLTTGMHEACPGSKVIWYDSVTVDGNLKWQNSLNKMNQPFFDLCDGIFLNYIWNEPLLRASAELAGNRKGEVYVGVDVFGRGCYGGGGYNTNKALAVIQQMALSAAIFAPGWVFETQEKAQFFLNQDRFWSLLSPFCPAGQPCTLPVVSSFCRGYGQIMAVSGKVVLQRTWTNLSAQDLQPSFKNSMIRNNPKSATYLETVEVDTEDAYNGGSSLKLYGRMKGFGSNLPATARLFRTAIDPIPLLVVYTFKKDSSHVSHCLQLQTSHNVLFLDPVVQCAGKAPNFDLPISGELPLPSDWPGPALRRIGALPSPHCDTLHHIFTGSPIHLQGDWKTKYFIIPCEFMTGPVTTVGVAVLPPSPTPQHPAHDFTLSIGEIKIMDTKCLSLEESPSFIHNLHCNDIIISESNTISLTLNWTVSNNSVDPIAHCNVYVTCLLGKPDGTSSCWSGDSVYLGFACANCFRVCDMHLLSSDLKQQPFGLKFRVQAVTLARRMPNVEDSDCLAVWFSP